MNQTGISPKIYITQLVSAVLLCTRHFTYIVLYLIARGDAQYTYTKWQVLSMLTHCEHRHTKYCEDLRTRKKQSSNYMKVGVAYSITYYRSIAVFQSYCPHSNKMIFVVQTPFGGTENLGPGRGVGKSSLLSGCHLGSSGHLSQGSSN